MKKVITYGTFDLLHAGHIRLLKRAKALGDYLIVAVTSDNFDNQRGKINVKQSVIERAEAVKDTGIADKIIIEEYDGQKIDDIVKYGVDIFTVGSDWTGAFDYLKEYCEVVYLDRTQGISSSQIRSNDRTVNIGLYGNCNLIKKFCKECKYVNGAIISGFYDDGTTKIDDDIIEFGYRIYSSYEEFLDSCDAVYIANRPDNRFYYAKKALEKGKHIICESPIAISTDDYDLLKKIAEETNCIIMDAVKTAYSIAYMRLKRMCKAGCIGNVTAISSTCTSLSNINYDDQNELQQNWSSMFSWGATALLPVFQMLGTDYNDVSIKTMLASNDVLFDKFTKMDFQYNNAIATLLIGKGIKSDGSLIISGTKGYIVVPAPWWKTDYFEIRYENPQNNQRCFFRLDGEGIRNEIAAFVAAIKSGNSTFYITEDESLSIIKIFEQYNARKFIEING